MNRTNITVQSAKVVEDNEKLLDFCLHSESARANMQIIANCHGQLEGGPPTMILRLEAVNHTKLQ